MKVEILAKRAVFDGFFHIEEATLRYERFNGEMSEPIKRLSLERGDSVAAVVLERDSNRIVLAHQFKYPAYEKDGGWLLEAIAGMIDDDESPEDALRRELLEEAGYTPREMELIGTFYLSPGGSSERVLLYHVEVDKASRIGSGGGLAAEGEDIQLRYLELAEAWAALDAGKIRDAKTFIGLTWMRARLMGS